jgi:ribonuclease BN (tRNA processing enzyme)
MNISVIFLGTNGWYDTETGNTICVMIRSDKYNIILDAGNGFHRVDRYANPENETYLFLSHFHLDHVIGLHILNRMQPLGKIRIFGPAGTKNALGMLLNTPFTMPANQLPFKIEIHELPEEIAKLPFRLEVMPLKHTQLTLGYRIEIDGRVITYCPDTGYCENAVTLARYADLLITECAYRSGEVNDAWPHLNPETASRIAREANAKKLALVHFDAFLYPTLDDRKNAEKEAKKTFPDAVATMDEMLIELPQGGCLSGDDKGND